MTCATAAGFFSQRDLLHFSLFPAAQFETHFLLLCRADISLKQTSLYDHFKHSSSDATGTAWDEDLQTL